jgi:hypothetical protein
MEPISIIISWAKRPEIADTLDKNRLSFVKHKAEIIVVNCGGDEQWLDTTLTALNIPGLRQIYIPVPSFNKGLATNVGVCESSHAHLFLLDTDIILASDILGEATGTLNEHIYMKIKRVRESHPDENPFAPAFLKEEILTREITCVSGRRAVMRFFTHGDGSRCGSGLLLLQKRLFLAVGGFNSSLKGWGFEDIDFQLRLQFSLGIEQVPVGEVIHLTHSDAVRNIQGKSKDDDWSRNMWICYRNYELDALKGTYEMDIEAWRNRTFEHEGTKGDLARTA